MSKRWSTKSERLWAYRYLVARDGELCLICERRPSRRISLDIDHIDNNPKNDDPDNLCLLCPSCNNRMKLCKVHEKIRLIRYKSALRMCMCVNGHNNDKGQDVRHDYAATSQVKELLDYSSGTIEMKANALFERDFREWLLTLIGQYHSYPIKEAINAGAEKLGCSPATTKRYLDKLTSSTGVFDLSENSQHQKVLIVKPHLIRDSLRLENLIIRTERRIEKHNGLQAHKSLADFRRPPG